MQSPELKVSWLVFLFIQNSFLEGLVQATAGKRWEGFGFGFFFCGTGGAQVRRREAPLFVGSFCELSK